MRLCNEKDEICKLRLRKASGNDVPLIGSLLLENFPHMEYDIPMWIDYVRRRGRNYIIETPNKTPVGYINVEKMRGIGVVNFIAISPMYRNRGIGSKALGFAEKTLKSKKLKLYTEYGKPQNIAFYMKNGWLPYTIHTDGYGHDFSVEFRKEKH